MAIYYMRADGTAANLAAAVGPASDASKCMSLATYNAEAAGSFSPGDIIRISSQGGDFDCTSSNVVIKISGTSGNLFVFMNEPGESPIFDAHQTRAHCLYSTGKSYITLEGLTFKNAITRQIYFRSETTNISNITIENCAFSGNGGGAGIQFFTELTYNMSTVTVSNCTFDTLDGDGILFTFGTADGSGIYHTITIEDCVFNSLANAGAACCGFNMNYTNPANAMAAGRLSYGITIQNNTFSYINHCAIRIYCTDTASNLIANNIISYAGYGQGYHTNAIQTHHCKGLTIEHNDVSYTGTSWDGDGCGIIIDWANTDSDYISEDCVVRYNHCHHNADIAAGATPSGINIYRGKNCEIYYNISDHNYRGINQNFHASNPSTGNVYYNNTIADNDEDGVEIYTDGPTSIWTNNVFVNNAGYGFADYGAVDATVTYSCFYNNTTGNYTGFTPGIGCIEVDPIFYNPNSNDYSLKLASPCRNTGDNTVWSGTANITDYAGNAITDGSGNIIAGTVDMGAHEFSAFNTQVNPYYSLESPIAGSVKITDQSVIIQKIVWAGVTTAGHLLSLVDKGGNPLYKYSADTPGASGALTYSSKFPFGLAASGIYCDDMDSGEIFIYLKF